MEMMKHTPGPWEYVPSTEHHGPYVTTEYGSTVCDCYCMSNPLALSVRNGGTSKPIHHMHEMAEANARLIAAAPDFYQAALLRRAYEALPADRGGANGPKGRARQAWLDAEGAAIAKATGEAATHD